MPFEFPSTPIVDPNALTWAPVPGWALDNRAECRSCKAPIAWMTNNLSGRKEPFDPDGTSHMGSCPQSDQWRKRPKKANRP